MKNDLVPGEAYEQISEWIASDQSVVGIDAKETHIIIKVDVDKNQQAAAKYGIQGVPALILFKKGRPVWRQSGVVPAHMLKQVIERNL